MQNHEIDEMLEAAGRSVVAYLSVVDDQGQNAMMARGGLYDSAMLHCEYAKVKLLADLVIRLGRLVEVTEGA
jgi:hypothetical protein